MQGNETYYWISTFILVWYKVSRDGFSVCLFPPTSTLLILWTGAERKGEEYFSQALNGSENSSQLGMMHQQPCNVPKASLDRHECCSWPWAPLMRCLIFSVDLHWLDCCLTEMVENILLLLSITVDAWSNHFIHGPFFHSNKWIF